MWGLDKDLHPANRYKAIVDADTGKLFAIVSQDYRVIRHERAIEQIEEFKEMEGVAGIHFMAIEWEHKVPEIAERAGVLPRPKVL